MASKAYDEWMQSKSAKQTNYLKSDFFHQLKIQRQAHKSTQDSHQNEVKRIALNKKAFDEWRENKDQLKKI